MSQYTFGMIKPDAVSKNHIGAILQRIEQAHLRVAALRMQMLSIQQAEHFYLIHAARPFYRDLVQFMCEGPIVAMALYGEQAIGQYRTLMGATNPKDAAPGTLRALFGESIDRNAVHGSDGEDTAQFELSYFFSKLELFGV